MSEFGWTRLAYLSVILAILAVLVKLGTLGANSVGESFPTSMLTFSQGNQPISEEHLDWGNRPKEDSEGVSESPSAERSEEHSDEEEESHDEGSHDHSHEPVEGIYENVNFAEDAPVFYRPTPQVSGASRNPSSSGMADKSCQTVGDAPPGSEIIFPVTREHFDSYDDTWGAARPQGGHEGTDLMVPTGTPLLAMTDARVVPVSGANANGWNTLGGYTVMLEAAYSVGPVKEGDLFYYAHMDEKSDLQIGDTVRAGDAVGYAGDTGQGPEGASGQFPPHLHLGWYETSGERTQLASGAMNPFPLLEWVKANGGSIAGGSDIPYCEAPQSSAPTPSDGGYWQFPSDPGTRPDMATGGGTAAPSPVVEENDSVESSPDITREKRRSVRQPNPDNPAPPENAEEPDNAATPPSNGNPNGNPGERPPNTPPRFPNLPNPLPGIGDGIRDIIGGVIGARPPERPGDKEPTEPNIPAPPGETTTPGETPPPENTTPDDEEAIPEITTPDDEETVPEATNPDAPGDEEAEDDECEPRERGDEKEGKEVKPGDEPRERGGEECSEETDSGDEGDPAPDETTGQTPPEDTPTDDAVGDQYEDGQPEDGESPPETMSGS